MDDVLRVIVDARDGAAQKGRIAFGNRLAAIEAGRDTATGETIELYKRWFERFARMEDELDAWIRQRAQGHEIVEIMCHVKGVGYLNAAKVISMIDIGLAPTASALWRYAGYAVVDGKAERHVKGEKSHFNSYLKIEVRKVGVSMMRCRSPYSDEYYLARGYYDAEHEEWTPNHRHNAAMRKMVKLWLQHLWLYWRTLEGLPTGEPYIIATDPQHTHYKKPTDYGWPPLEPPMEMAA